MSVKQNGIEALAFAARVALEGMQAWVPCPEDDCEVMVPAEAVEVTVRLDGDRLETHVVQTLGTHAHDDNPDVLVNDAGEEVGRIVTRHPAAAEGGAP